MAESTGAPPKAAPPPSGTVRLTLLCLCALVVGVGAGVLSGGGESGWAGGLATAADAVVRAWTNAFRLLIAPLVVSQLYLAVSGNGLSARGAGRVGLAVPAVFLGLLVFSAAVSTALALGLCNLPVFTGISLRPIAPAALPVGPPGGIGWVDGIIPPNLLAAAATDNILPLMLFAIAFGIAMRRASAASSETVARLAGAVAQASFTIVGWLISLAPVVILALGYGAALDSGLDVGTAVLGFAALEAVIVLALIALLYPLTTLAGAVSPVRLARALWPAQLTALATRSSLATLPALFRSAEATLGVRHDTCAYVLPLAGATLKISRAATGPIRLIFLAQVLGIPLGAGQVAVFVATIMLLSASTVGVPSVSSGNRSLPAYVAAGIPAEYVVLLGVAVNLTDALLTLYNTTGYLSATAIVERLRPRLPSPSHPAATPAAPRLRVSMER